MAAYVSILMVNPRTEASFKREELETAARILFYTSPPDELRIHTPPDELRLEWHDEFFGGRKCIRVIGDIEPPAEPLLTDESWWTG